jgi:hypothetical protein
MPDVVAATPFASIRIDVRTRLLRGSVGVRHAEMLDLSLATFGAEAALGGHQK